MEFFGNVYRAVALLALTLLTSVRCQTSTVSTTPDPFSASANCSNTLMQCMDNSTHFDQCTRSEYRLRCYGNTRPYGCSVNNNTVSFADLIPTYTAICSVTGSQESCWQYSRCVMTLDYNVMAASINISTGPSLEQGRNMTSTGFWCRSLQQTMTCLTSHAENCGVSAMTRSVYSSLNYWLGPTCNGKDVTVSSQCQDYVTSCMRAGPPVNGTRACSDQLTEMQCLASSSNHGCTVREMTNVTFDDLSNVHLNVCQVVTPVYSECQAMQECVHSQYYHQMPGMTGYSQPTPPPIIFSGLLSTQFWCHHMKQQINCFIKTYNACGISTSDINAFKTNTSDYVKELCAGDKGNAGGLNYNGATSISVITHLLVILLLPLLLTPPSHCFFL